MSFRKIRPSFGESSASASTSNPSTSESAGSDPRRNRGEGASREGEGSQSSFKRRRVPESVTRNACLNCKKARAKCDGKQPCKRCASRVESSECVYEVHIKHAKEELVRQIKVLKTKDQMTEQILHALSTDEKVPEILERLRKGESYQSIVEWLGRTPMEDGETFSPRGSQHSTFEGPASDQEMGGAGATAFRWTYVTSNTAVLDHLFQLFFAWVHPVHTLFSEGYFVDSYQRQSDQYCSETLVNAICAMACHLHSPVEGEDIDFQQLGLDFSEAVRSNIEPQDSSITTIQAFAVLFLVDCSQGKALRASSYLNVASNNLARFKPLHTDGFSVVLNNTIRGVRSLNIEWSQMTFRVPTSVDLACSLYNEDADALLDNAKWYFYRYVNDQCPAWPGLLATTNREKAKLVKIIEESLHIMYAAHGQRGGALDILLLYRRLVAWREDLPAEIGDVENNTSQALPHILSLLILYENTVVQLLRPLLDFEGFPSSLVEDVVWNHGQYALSLLDEHYRTQYTCRYQPVLQMFSVLHISDMMARFFPMATEGVEGSRKDGAQAIQFGLECLMQSRIGFPIAGPLQEMLRRTAIECSIRLPPNLPELMAPLPSSKQMYHMDDLIDACTRPSYIQPVDDIHKMYTESFTADWISASAAFGFREPEPGARRLRVTSAEERGAQSLMQIRNLLNS